MFAKKAKVTQLNAVEEQLKQTGRELDIYISRYNQLEGLLSDINENLQRFSVESQKRELEWKNQAERDRLKFIQLVQLLLDKEKTAAAKLDEKFQIAAEQLQTDMAQMLVKSVTSMEDTGKQLLREIFEKSQGEHQNISNEKEKWESLKRLDIKFEAPQKVTFNVGGILFSASAKTLSKCSDSILAAIVSGLYPIPRDANGNVFLDRDPYLFRIILNYLRSDKIDIPESTSLRAALLREAEFFKIYSLIPLLRNDSERRVVLNVGGRKFETYVSTLTQFPDTLLGAMFSDRNQAIVARRVNGDGNEEYFFDRSSSLFEIILQFYRTGGKLVIPPSVTTEMLLPELEYFNIPAEEKASRGKQILHLATSKRQQWLTETAYEKEEVDFTLGLLLGKLEEIIQSNSGKKKKFTIFVKPDDTKSGKFEGDADAVIIDERSWKVLSSKYGHRDVWRYLDDEKIGEVSAFEMKFASYITDKKHYGFSFDLSKIKE